MYQDRYPTGFLHPFTYIRENRAEIHKYNMFPVEYSKGMFETRINVANASYGRGIDKQFSQLDPEVVGEIDPGIAMCSKGLNLLWKRAQHLRGVFLECDDAQTEYERLKATGELSQEEEDTWTEEIGALKHQFERECAIIIPHIEPVLKIAHDSGHVADKYQTPYDVIVAFTCGDEDTAETCFLDLCEDDFMVQGSVGRVCYLTETCKDMSEKNRIRCSEFIKMVVERDLPIWDNMKENNREWYAMADSYRVLKWLAEYEGIRPWAPHYPAQYAFELVDAWQHDEPRPVWDPPEIAWTCEEVEVMHGMKRPSAEREHKTFPRLEKVSDNPVMVSVNDDHEKESEEMEL